MPDLRAECLAMADDLDTFDEERQNAEPFTVEQRCHSVAALLRRVADALAQEPKGDVVEKVAVAISGAPFPSEKSRLRASAALFAAEPFIQARIAEAIELATAAARDPLSGRAAIQDKPEDGE